MIICTDGSANPNPGPGGYGVIFLTDDEKYINCYSHYENETTNNIQELKGLIYSFIFASQNPNHYFTIISDSAYAINVFEQWAPIWEQNNWTKADNKPIKNLILIKEGYKIFKELSNCTLKKIKGHNNYFGNELADALASNNIKKFNILLNNYKKD